MRLTEYIYAGNVSIEAAPQLKQLIFTKSSTYGII